MHEETLRVLEARGWRVHVALTAEAVRAFNEADPREGAVAALHLTC